MTDRVDHVAEAQRRMDEADPSAAAKFPVHFAMAHALIDVAISLRHLTKRF